MQVTKETLSPTSLKLTIAGDQKAIDSVKHMVLEKLGKTVKVSGFREGTAPSKMVEKQIDQSTLQNEFLNEALNQFYAQVIKDENIRVTKEPEVSITKFVPFSTLEFTAEVDVIGEIKLGNYKTIKLTPKKVSVTTKEVDQVLENLRDRSAEKKPVNRAAKNDDEVILDFKGVDTKTKEPIDGAGGSDYPLVLGSKTFIPGFEDEIIGLKPKAEKTFDIVFPADYNVESLKKRKVTFSVTIKTVSELKKPKLDDEFAKTVGPFTNLDELKSDIKKQLETEKQTEIDQDLNNQVLQQLADLSDVAIPSSIVDQEIERLEQEEKQNLTYRGQTWQEHLAAEGVDEQGHRAKQKPLAETRIKTGLLLGEVSDKEDIQVTPEELNSQIAALKAQYTDDKMRLELDKPENQRDIYSRIVIDKTVKRLREIAETSKAKAK